MQVLAPPLSKAEMTEKLNNLTGEGSIMAELISSGDSGSAANVVAAAAGMLNIAAAEASTTSIATASNATVCNGTSGCASRRRRSAPTPSKLYNGRTLR